MKNNSIKAYIEKNILLIDGAMGTYYASQENDYNHLSEKANLEKPEAITNIHNAYIGAGAKLIRTNTFSANRYDMACSVQEVNKVLQKGYDIATACALNQDVFVACSIGPITETSESSETEIMGEYYRIIDVFLNLGAKAFVFETFSQTDYIKKFVPYILDKNKDAEIIALFTINLHGYSKKGIGYKRMIEELTNLNGLTAFGFNCGVGAGHLYNLYKNIDLEKNIYAAVPNAGYPEKIYDRTLYMDNSDYFAEKIIDICKLGVKIVGGCCGTTPAHIQQISNYLETFEIEAHRKKNSIESLRIVSQKKENPFWEKLDRGEFVVAVEIDPPFGYDISKLMEAAHILKAEGVDILTIADSPLGKMRLDSLMMATKIYREVGIDVMPHVCCRDKNVIALKSVISAAYVEGIRNYLLVTGDPLPDILRNEIKSVFNMNSVKLMSLVKEMNEELTNEDVFIYGGALNPKGANLDKIIEKVLQKKEAGAKYLLTQPIYTEQDIQKLRLIKEKTGIKILGGILPLVSYKNAQFINNEFAGMNIPDVVINMFNTKMSREEAEEVGIHISVELGKAMTPVVDGLYLMTPFNRATMIGKILKRLH
ncbi:MAG: bifunctional homocysteine S-methyltransferase/methylenetetrahydrofolate reductase [Firmicutes bacterium HGW-Firmicutes-1]|jgi:homocysteine S-methyltransferase|nr:MAG: bifunctional homocysteine S-methyltransferase/methylenetetrahydrofolate reductase [Firmicutes bacterium HGW-Firmicutes-1]